MLDLHAVENQAKYKLRYRNKRTDRVTHTHTGFIELLRNSKLINFLENFYKNEGKEVALVETNEKNPNKWQRESLTTDFSLV